MHQKVQRYLLQVETQEKSLLDVNIIWSMVYKKKEKEIPIMYIAETGQKVLCIYVCYNKVQLFCRISCRSS